MLKVAVAVFVLVAVCYAQPPPAPTPPDIPETFMSMITVHKKDHRGEHMGKGIWSRDFEKGMALETAQFTIMNETFEEHFLQLFDMHMSYIIKMNSTGTYCEKHDIPQNEKMREMWDWVKSDHAHGDEHKEGSETIDRWSISLEGGSHLMLFVNEMDLKVPLGLLRVGRGGEEDIKFMGFKPMEPPASDFVVPPACN